MSSQKANELDPKASTSHHSQASARSSPPRKLFFPEQKIYEMMKLNFAGEIRPDCVIFLTGILEYVASEVLEQAGNYAKSRNDTTITNTDIETVIKLNPELKDLILDMVVSNRV